MRNKVEEVEKEDALRLFGKKLEMDCEELTNSGTCVSITQSQQSIQEIAKLAHNDLSFCPRAIIRNLATEPKHGFYAAEQMMPALLGLENLEKKLREKEMATEALV